MARAWVRIAPASALVKLDGGSVTVVDDWIEMSVIKLEDGEDGFHGFIATSVVQISCHTARPH